MRWQDLRRSSNIEDRRGIGGKVVTGGAGGVFAMALIVYLLGGDPTSLIMEGVGRTIATSQSRQSELTPEQQNEQADFTAAVLGSTEDAWGAIFSQQGQMYEVPRLVLFAGAVDSACGMAQSAMGPFYCPLDKRVYLDLDFFHELEAKFGAPGDFARAYVIAHEVGHHVQNLEGTLGNTNRQRSNDMSVRTELQADCYAGVWAASTAMADTLEQGDIEEAIRAASMIGDDHLQKEAQGFAVPDSFTHGSSAQRVTWFRKGFESGTTKACDTFNSKI
jgi:hypothetical protein